MRHENDFLGEDPRAAIRDLVGQAYATRFDLDTFLGFFHEDAVFHIIGRVPAYPYSGLYVGKPAIRAALARIDGDIEQTDGRMLNILVEGDTIGIRRRNSLRHRGTAARLDIMVGNLIKFRDFKITELYEYIDTSWHEKLAGD
ncbi:Ketosteroid isomerase-related protein [Rhodoblastus acidophilus]|uniref:Ketosteroid isomerase-related protein n=1 Tax=Rhodoblastus acidophilus TaxID=1074 RepID=A0A212QMF3_RHOAC|nr:nuclear transport factor 2 family protein [Rhodoblastus acidophilus]MCW2317750.1 ketosteroid isomerase-like protein [Rhodoblastus acidophilus]PPQ36208.1 nuclear transport factor 2 family protein [Rhodoblastus acidophilus]RAI17179.1 nuclear transport factor 2 family protein [Rhodoblastus acidophilus]SNB60525.1 Ketosteroid isomerase-related protein [Rhodoblastus acidophilus]